MIKAIIFDCFGVVLTDALQALCDEKLAEAPEQAEEVNELVKAASRGVLLPREAEEKIASVLGMSAFEYSRYKVNNEARNTRLLSTIKDLKKNYKTAMLSNTSKGGLLARFSADELTEYFDIAVASGDIGFVKPDTRAYEYVVDKLKVRLDECVFIDDREEYCFGAESIGMQSIRYHDFNQFSVLLSRLLNS